MAQPTEQCVQTVRLTSTVPPLSSAAASAFPIMLNGNCAANVPAPTATPERFRNARRSCVFTCIPVRPRPSLDPPRADERLVVAPVDFLVNIMVALLDSDFCGVVVAADVRGLPISLAAAFVFARCGLRAVGRDDAAGDRGRRRRAA